MNLNIEVHENGEVLEVELAGEIDAHTAPDLKKTIIPLTEQANKIVVVDLKQVNYMDSTGLGVFIGALKSANENNSKLRLTSLQERVRRLFDITGLDSIITIDDSTVRGEN